MKKATPAGIVLYNPPRAKRRLSPEDFDLLANRISGLLGIKVAGGDSDWHQAMRAESEIFRFHSGGFYGNRPINERKRFLFQCRLPGPRLRRGVKWWLLRFLKKVGYPFRLPLEVHAGWFLVERARTFFENQQKQPFFLYLSFHDPHHPFTVPEQYANMYEPEKMPPRIPFHHAPLHSALYSSKRGVKPNGLSGRLIGTPQSGLQRLRSQRLAAYQIDILRDGNPVGSVDRTGLGFLGAQRIG